MNLTADTDFCFDLESLAGVSRHLRMEIPERYNSYRCSDYFASFTQGVWSGREQMWLIVSADDVVEQPERDYLVVGKAGVDGVEFGYRREHDGIWAHYPIGNDFRFVAPSVSALVEGWLGGSIRV